jgi:hypothetical protein
MWPGNTAGDKALIGNTASALSQDDQRGALCDRSRQDRGGEEARRHLRAAYQHRSLEAMFCYKQLWKVEQTFRTAKLEELSLALRAAGVALPPTVRDAAPS